jgi:hypothetical protein
VSATNKIYTDDPLIKFSGTTVPAMRSKQLTDAVLAEYQVKDVWWHYDPPREVWVSFKIVETVKNIPIDVSVRIDCSPIWDRARTKRNPHTPEKINWDVSMRAMYHFIYTHLNSAYAMQSSNTVAFLGFIQTGKEGERLKDIVLPKMHNLAALDAPKEEPMNVTDESKIVDITIEKSPPEEPVYPDDQNI